MGSGGDSDKQRQGGGGPPPLPPRLVQDHADALLKRARRFPRLTREQAEDLVGDVWLYAFRNLEAVLQHPNPRAWLLRVLANRYIDYCRSPKPASIEGGHLATLSGEDQRFARFENHEALMLAVQALPPDLARVLRLRLEDLTLHEIGQRLEISTSEAGKRVGRAYQLLSEFIKRDRP
ncbi:MAG TPA: sigma-70 family RNA polymerase sigma factor [Myxococcales bacterium]|nr:sigma-70 family RNA polymerase sigma factor [Myxococcales bacterium]